ncbi:MAG: hypothetical protein M3R15_31710 [Acidobacteriota bacterium]|nr:hypothetical protein [Acidobacteriota bacterium]
MLPEESLSFTIDKSFFDDIARRAYQTRGLLRLKKWYMGGDWDLGTHRLIEEKNINLLFAKQDDFKPKDTWESEYCGEPKTIINLANVLSDCGPF